MVASEIVKAQANAGRRRELYYFRDKDGLEVDFIVPSRGGKTSLIEAKATKTPRPQMGKPLATVAKLFDVKSNAVAMVVHQKPRADTTTSALYPGVTPGVTAVTIEALTKQLGG